MMYPVVLLTTPNSEWAKSMRRAIEKQTCFTMTASVTRLKRIVRSYPSEVIIIIDTKQISNPSRLIAEIKNLDEKVIVLAATSSLTWEDTVSYMKAGAADILPKTMDAQRIIASLHQLVATPYCYKKV